jgi:hypothetical protein
MQRLDVMRVPCALAFIPDESAAKGGHSKHQQFLVEVQAGANGHVVRALPGQGLNTVVSIKRCPKAIKESAAGTQYRMAVKVADDGSLSTHFSWPYELAA